MREWAKEALPVWALFLLMLAGFAPVIACFWLMIAPPRQPTVQTDKCSADECLIYCRGGVNLNVERLNGNSVRMVCQ